MTIKRVEAVEQAWTPLILKYNMMGPRYTSYPTALQFEESFNQDDIRTAVNRLESKHPISLYLHIPFCENICFYCACNKLVTRNKEKAITYLRFLKSELNMYAELVKNRPVKQIHFGGGTPNFLTVEQIQDLMLFINEVFHVEQTLDLSIELDPRFADKEYLNDLQKMGFNRLSFGVQDLQPKVQKAINRVCSEEQIEKLILTAKTLNFSSIHIDLIYGLPHQSKKSFAKTLSAIAAMKPDRLSMFNYAHLPHRFPPQRRIKEEDLPSAKEKLNILYQSINYLTLQGYCYIGMDHFALLDSPLSQLQNEGKLHRNFQGYSTHGDCALIAVGVSGISQIDNIYIQNFRKLEEYYAVLDVGKMPIWRGYEMHQDDKIRRALIMQLICHGSLDIKHFETQWNLRFSEYFAEECQNLEQQQKEGLLNFNNQQLTVTRLGWLLIRNICMIFDAYLNQFIPMNSFSRVI